MINLVCVLLTLLVIFPDNILSFHDYCIKGQKTSYTSSEGCQIKTEEDIIRMKEEYLQNLNGNNNNLIDNPSEDVNDSNQKNESPRIKMLKSKIEYAIKTKEFDLSKSEIDNSSFKTLIKLVKKKVPDLTILNFRVNHLTIDAVNILSKFEFPELEFLCFDANFISDEGLIVISNMNFPKLKVLGVENNQITDKGFLEFTKKKFPELEGLYLTDNHISDAGFESITPENFPKLKHISLIGNRFSVVTQESLKAKFPSIFILV
eukprot:c30771_g1_i1.p1 GENE.c30771_g1_i1~~c30771_g1_i1.p1  ORF type:complete len:262 (-),score=79.16 c30771_g1_i1:79-864(-)